MRTRNRFTSVVTLAAAVLMLLPSMALASEVAVVVVDITAPTDSLSLAPGESGNININMSVSGNQEGIATFEVFRDWTLSGGVFSGSNPQEFTVAPRAGGAPATTFTTTGTVSAHPEQANGTFTLAVGAFDITNSNSSGAKLAAGNKSSYQVVVNAPTDSCAAVSSPAAPVFTAGQANGNNGWFTTVPSATAVSATNGATVTYSTDGANFSSTVPTLGEGVTTVTAKATSATCGKASTSERQFKVDTIAPHVNPDDVNNTVWRNTSLSETFGATDTNSELADPTDASFTLTALTESSTAAPTSVSKTVSDKAGNSTTRTLSALIDLTKPTNEVTGVSNGHVYPLGSVPPAACNTTDSLSGTATTATASAVDNSSLGSKTVTCSGGADVAGNVADSVAVTYSVQAVSSGFFSPVEKGPWVNKAKTGRNVPLKWRLTDASGNPYTGLTSTQANVVLTSSSLCTNSAPTDEVEVYSTSTSGLQNLGDGYYQIDWKTPTTQGCRTVTVSIPGGGGPSAVFSFTK